MAKSSHLALPVSGRRLEVGHYYIEALDPASRRPACVIKVTGRRMSNNIRFMLFDTNDGVIREAFLASAPLPRGRSCARVVEESEIGRELTQKEVDELKAPYVRQLRLY